MTKTQLPLAKLAYSAGTDVANRAMRAAGRTKWSREDYNKAVKEYNRVMGTRQ